MKPETLRTIGEALHGSAWQERLAADLDITSRAIGYYLTGRTIPADMPERLAALLWKQSTLLAGLAKSLTG